METRWGEGIAVEWKSMHRDSCFLSKVYVDCSSMRRMYYLSSEPRNYNISYTIYNTTSQLSIIYTIHQKEQQNSCIISAWLITSLSLLQLPILPRFDSVLEYFCASIIRATVYEQSSKATNNLRTRSVVNIRIIQLYFNLIAGNIAVFSTFSTCSRIIRFVVVHVWSNTCNWLWFSLH